MIAPAFNLEDHLPPANREVFSAPAQDEIIATLAIGRVQPELDAMFERQRKMEAELVATAMACDRLVELARQYPDEIDRIVDAMLQRERETERFFRPQIRSLETALKKTAHRPAAYRATIGLLQERQHDAMVAHMSLLRDTRWRLMALRAELKPSEIVGQIRGRQTDLDAYLAALE